MDFEVDLQIFDGWRSKGGSDDDVLAQQGSFLKPDAAFLTGDDGGGKW